MTKREKEYLQMVEAGVSPGKRGYKMLFKVANEGRLEYDDSTPTLKRIGDKTKALLERQGIIKPSKS